MEQTPQGHIKQNALLKQENQKLGKQNQLLLEKIKQLEKKIQQLNIEKNESKEDKKIQDGHKKCSHGHGHQHNEHGHSHSHDHKNHQHNHHHNSHNHQSSQQQNPSQPKNMTLEPPHQKGFLHKIYKTQEQINFRYFRLPLKTIKAWKKDQGIQLSKNKACMLHLRQMKLNVGEFVKQVWEDVQWINLPQCQIEDEGWRSIVENAETSFPDLRVIGIRWNKIKTIKEGDLQKFKKLMMIDLGVESQQNNPLSPQTREVLKNYSISHPTVKVQ